MTGERSTTWWHVYPLGALAGTPDDGHRLLRLLPWLEHAASLGATGLQLGPVFASTSHGYDTLDHGRIDPRLGTEEDFRTVVDAAHARGLRVMLDGVFSHVGAAHPLHRRALAEGPGSDASRLFRIDWSDPTRPRTACFEGHESLVLLDHREPAVEAMVGDVMRRWLDRGADAWRLDAAYAVDPSFWARVLPRVRAAHPDVVVVGEVIHGDYAGIVERGGLDAVTQYELWKAVWSSVLDRNLFELAWALDRHGGFLRRFVPYTFIGNHDVTRVASLVGEAGAAVALLVLMTVGGTPAVYYGDEWGARGVKEHRAGGDDAVRPPLPDGPAAIHPEGQGLLALHRRLGDLRHRHPWLERSTTEVRELAATRLVYETGDGPTARVEIDLAASPRGVVRVGDEAVATAAAAA